MLGRFGNEQKESVWGFPTENDVDVGMIRMLG